MIFRFVCDTFLHGRMSHSAHTSVGLPEPPYSTARHGTAFALVPPSIIQFQYIALSSVITFVNLNSRFPKPVHHLRFIVFTAHYSYISRIRFNSQYLPFSSLVFRCVRGMRGVYLERSTASETKAADGTFAPSSLSPYCAPSSTYVSDSWSTRRRLICKIRREINFTQFPFIELATLN